MDAIDVVGTPLSDQGPETAVTDTAALEAEVKRLRRQIADRSQATVYERTAWHHDIGEHAGSDLPYGFCPRCEIEHPQGILALTRAENEELRTALRTAWLMVRCDAFDAPGRVSMAIRPYLAATIEKFQIDDDRGGSKSHD